MQGVTRPGLEKNQRKLTSLKLKDISVLKERLKGKTVIVGIGNTLRGDDGAGPELIRKLKSSLQFTVYSLQKTYQLFLLDVGEVPENYLEKIAEYKPDIILLVDVVDFKSQPGSIKIIEAENIKEAGFSTHNASLSLAMRYLKKETRADIFMLGIQPKSLRMNNGLSKPVKEALNRIEEFLIRRFAQKLETDDRG